MQQLWHQQQRRVLLDALQLARLPEVVLALLILLIISIDVLYLLWPLAYKQTRHLISWLDAHSPNKDDIMSNGSDIVLQDSAAACMYLGK